MFAFSSPFLHEPPVLCGVAGAILHQNKGTCFPLFRFALFRLVSHLTHFLRLLLLLLLLLGPVFMPASINAGTGMNYAHTYLCAQRVLAYVRLVREYILRAACKFTFYANRTLSCLYLLYPVQPCRHCAFVAIRVIWWRTYPGPRGALKTHLAGETLSVLGLYLSIRSP